MSEGVSEEVKRSFGERCEGARRAVWAVIRQRRAEEPELAWSEVCVRAWRHYPRMYREERAALAAGEKAPHDWTAWMVKIAVNYLIDAHRRRHGRRRAACPEEDGSGGRRRMRREPMVLPLYAQVIPAPAESDPLVRLVLEEAWREMDAALGRLDREERLALGVVVLDDVADDDVAVTLGTSPRTVRRRRQRAIGRVREGLTACGLGEGRHFRVAV